MSLEETVYETKCMDCNNIFYTLKDVKVYHSNCPYCKSEIINDNIKEEYILTKK